MSQIEWLFFEVFAFTFPAKMVRLWRKIAPIGDFHSKERQFFGNRFCSGVSFALKAATVLH